MKRALFTFVVALSGPLAASFGSGCRGIYGLGEEPTDLAGEGGAASGSSTSSSTSSAPAGPGGSGGGGATGTGTGTGGGDGGAPGPCGGCSVDGDCGDAPGGLCGTDGRCQIAAWTLSQDAWGFGDDFALTDGLLAVVVDEGVLDVEASPQADNRLVLVDRATGEVRSVPLATTSLGSVGASPGGVIAFAPRVDDGAPLLQRLAPGDAGLAPWSGAEGLESALRGVRWDDTAAGAPRFLAIQEASPTSARLVLFGDDEPFSSCAASAPEIPLGVAWWGEGEAAARLVVAEGLPEDSTRAVARTTLEPDGCGAPEPALSDLGVLLGERVTALAATDGVLGVVLAGGTTSRALFVDEAGQPLTQTSMPGGRALTAAPGRLYVMRDPGDGGLCRIDTSDPGVLAPVAAFGGRLVLDVEWRSGALFGLTLDSNRIAELVCAVE